MQVNQKGNRVSHLNYDDEPLFNEFTGKFRQFSVMCFYKYVGF